MFSGKVVRVFRNPSTKTIAHAKIYKKLHLNEMLNEKALLFVESIGKYSFYTFRLFVFSAIFINFTYA